MTFIVIYKGDEDQIPHEARNINELKHKLKDHADLSIFSYSKNAERLYEQAKLVNGKWYKGGGYE